LLVAREWVGGSRATTKRMAALFAKRKTKFGGGGKIGIPPKADRLQARAGKNFFSQTLSLFARPSVKSKIPFKKSSSFRIKTAHFGKSHF